MEILTEYIYERFYFTIKFSIGYIMINFNKSILIFSLVLFLLSIPLTRLGFEVETNRYYFKKKQLERTDLTGLQRASISSDIQIIRLNSIENKFIYKIFKLWIPKRYIDIGDK